MAYGTVNADVIGTSVSGSNIGAGNASIMKNRIINGAMMIDQRNAGASVTNAATTAYTLDRFQYYASQASKFTIQQNAGSVIPPVGFSNYVGITSLSAYTPSAGEQFIFGQMLEGFNTADLQFGTSNAKTVTLSFWVRSSLTGTFGASLINSAYNRSYPFSYTISSANTWQQISVTIAGDTTGTWIGSTNGVGIRLYFSLGCGSTSQGTANAWVAAEKETVTGETQIVGTNGATFYITGVQLEVGSSATGFEYRQYGQELALCQRYYWALIGAQANTGASLGQAYTSTSANSFQIPFPVQLRAIPTLTYSALADWPIQAAGSGALTPTSIVLASSQQSYNSATLAVTVASGLVAGNATGMFANSTSARLNFSAEL